MRGRAEAAFAGIQAALGALPQEASRKQMGEAAVAAAEAAYDKCVYD
jgi:hypothetical protein